jgi:hypothetical protein
LAELEEAGIVERDFRGAIFSGKLLKDSQTSQKNYENGRKGGNPILIKSNELTSNSTEQPVNPPLNPREDKEKIREESFATLTPRARGRSPKQNGMRPDGREVDAAFERFWLAYPKRVGKGAARTSFARAILKAPIDTIMAAVQSQTFSPDPRYRPAPTTWLNQERWADEAPPDGPVPLDPSSPDPWGVNAWASRQPGSKREAEHWSIAGYYADVVMGHIAEAARIPESWRGNLDSLGDWLRADIPSKQIIAAVKAWAERSGYPSVTTLKFFDSAVRSQGQRRMG